jgi:DNA polymerase I-like protein with 3'-5' exonuclease and polymerase domains
MIYYITNQPIIFESNNIKHCTVEDSLKYLNKFKYIGVDTETEGLDPYTKRILSLQLGTYNDQFVIDASTVNLQKYKKLLEDPDKTFIFQNAKFDLKFLYHQRIVPSNIYDTMLAEMVLNTGIEGARKSLKYIAYKYWGVELDKEIRGKIITEGLSEKVIIYGADDVKYLKPIMNKQLKEIDKWDLRRALALDNLFVKVLAYIEYCGIYLDRDKWAAKMEKDYKRFQECKIKLDNWVISHNLFKYIDRQLDLFNPERKCSINWSSQKQVIPLFKELGIDITTIDDKTGLPKDSVEAKILIPQKDKFEIIPLYLEYKKAEKVVTTYGQTFLDQINKVSGRLHSNFTQIKATGRMSCGGKDSTTGIDHINLQNIPADGETRGCFTAPKGYKLVNCDYSGQEAVVFANKTLDPALLEFYDRKLGDMHSYIAKLCFHEDLKDIPLEKVKKERPDLRQKAKSAGFAIQYGGQGITIAQNLSIPIEEGNAIYEAYFNSFKGVKNYFKKCKEDALKYGYVQFNDISRRKSFIDFFDEYKQLEKEIDSKFWEEYRHHKYAKTDKFYSYYKPKVRKFFKMQGIIERKSYNYPIQGTSAEITKLAGVYIFNELQKRGWLFKVLFTNIVHDEVLLEAEEDLADEVAVIVQDCMERAGAKFYTRVPLKADPKVVDWWNH